MAVDRIWISGYRSLRRVNLTLGPLNVVTGANGSGKSNLYKGLQLIVRCATGGLGRAIAEEGGMESVMWAGDWPYKKPKRVQLGAMSNGFSFEIALGLPQALNTVFILDPEVKEEFLWHGPSRRPSTIYLNRKNSAVEVRGQAGMETVYPIDASESALFQVSQAELYPELALLRREIGEWRFYHHFDIAPNSPLRQSQVGTFSPVLDHDGRNVVAALQTIREIGDGETLRQAIDDAFPETALWITQEGSRFKMELIQPGLNRNLTQHEFSDGTLRFLCLAAALLTPRPPQLLVFNEPESSLHPDLLPALANLMVAASARCQLWIVTHSQRLLQLMADRSDINHIPLRLDDGETCVGSDRLDSADHEAGPQ